LYRYLCIDNNQKQKDVQVRKKRAHIEVMGLYSPRAEQIWDKIRGFQDISIWHPDVQSCSSTTNDMMRIIDLGNGLQLQERKTNSNTDGYTYENDGVVRYRSTISVSQAEPFTAVVVWSVSLLNLEEDSHLLAFWVYFLIRGLEGLGCGAIKIWYNRKELQPLQRFPKWLTNLPNQEEPIGLAIQSVLHRLQTSPKLLLEVRRRGWLESFAQSNDFACMLFQKQSPNTSD